MSSCSSSLLRSVDTCLQQFFSSSHLQRPRQLQQSLAQPSEVITRAGGLVLLSHFLLLKVVRRRMECGTVFSSAVCRLFPIERKTWRSFPFLFSDLKSKEEGRNAACRKYKPGSYLAEDCRMPQFLHLYHQGRGHSPCHHQLQQIFRVDTATYGHYSYNLCYLYSISYHFRYLKSGEIEFLSTSYCIYLPVSASKIRIQNQQKKHRKEDIKLTKMMLTIFILFLVCFLPLMLVNVVDDDMKMPSIHVVASVLAWMSASINPFVYAIQNQQYQEAFRALLCKKRSNEETNRWGGRSQDDPIPNKSEMLCPCLQRGSLTPNITPTSSKMSINTLSVELKSIKNLQVIDHLQIYPTEFCDNH